MRSLPPSKLTWLVALSFFVQTPAFAARFVDTSGNWTEKYINRLSDKGVVPAADNGKFNPDQPVTRAQLAVWLVKVLGIDNQPVPPTSSYADVKPSDPFFSAVEIIRQNNYLSGYADGFRPNQFIQRAEVMTILSRTLNEPQPDSAQIDAELGKYTDGKSVPEWAKAGVAEAGLAGIIINEKDPHMINPTAIATRGETVALLSRLDEYLGKKQAGLVTPASQQSGQPQAYEQQPSAPQASYGTPTAPYQPPYGQPYPQQPMNGQPPAAGGYMPPNYLQGGIAVVAAGTQFRAQLTNSLDSASTQPGEQVQATLGEPLYANGVEVVPAGSRLIGNVSNVISAKRFKAGANGKIDIHFSAIEMPDGRRFPLSGNADGTQINLSGGTTAGRIGQGIKTTAIGAGSGALVGTALGAIVGATGHGGVGRGVAMGAVFGTAIGGGAGAVGAVVRKGSEVKFPAGMTLPIKLDQVLQISGAQSSYYQRPNGYPPPQGNQGGFGQSVQSPAMSLPPRP